MNGTQLDWTALIKNRVYSTYRTSKGPSWCIRRRGEVSQPEPAVEGGGGSMWDPIPGMGVGEGKKCE